MDILEEFYFGNISIHDQYIERGSEIEELTNLICKTEEELNKILSDKQKKIFERYKSNYNELTTLDDCRIFIRGFSLGLRITFESLNEKFS